MKKPSSKYYPISDLADEWNWKIEDILHYGVTGELQISFLVPSEADPGPYPISKEDVIKFRSSDFGAFKVESLPDSVKEKWIDILTMFSTSRYQNLVVTHEERLHFEKKCETVKELGNKERENFLRLIGAFIERYYSKKTYRKSDNSPNADAISKEFHSWLLDNNFSDKGISEEKIRKMIPGAYNSIMENKKTKVKLKKILPS